MTPKNAPRENKNVEKYCFRTCNIVFFFLGHVRLFSLGHVTLFSPAVVNISSVFMTCNILVIKLSMFLVSSDV